MGSAVKAIARGSIGMTDPAASFEPHRRRLLGLAYRMLGSVSEAEDAVQDAYLRWHATDREIVSDARAFLTTTTTRICLDALKSARTRREAYVGPWLPEPVLDTAALAPDVQTELAEDLSIALLLALDRLSALERAAFLLHDVFDCSFGEVARALDRSEAACRQLASRARTHVREARPLNASALRDRSEPTNHQQLVAAFINAARSGDLQALMGLLAADVRLTNDGGGKVTSAPNVLEGRDRTARFAVGAVSRGLPQGSIVRIAPINGLPGLIVNRPDGSVLCAAFEIVDNQIRAIYVLSNPEKLLHLAPPA
jgi:RNA polymerase sigma-70 factor (ECF subfamily)